MPKIAGNDIISSALRRARFFLFISHYRFAFVVASSRRRVVVVQLSRNLPSRARAKVIPPMPQCKFSNRNPICMTQLDLHFSASRLVDSRPVCFLTLPRTLRDICDIRACKFARQLIPRISQRDSPLEFKPQHHPDYRRQDDI